MDNKIELNTVLYTKAGRVTGNAIVSGINGENSFKLTTDYGNIIKNISKSNIEACFHIGNIADSTHKNYTKSKCIDTADSNNFYKDWFDVAKARNSIDIKKKDTSISNIGSRFNTGKTQWGLVDFESLEGMVKVLEFGANKYGIGNWQKGLTTISIIESILRHIFAFMKGNDIDSESKLPHTDHIMCNAMFLAYMWRNKKQLDNRKEYNNENN